MSFPFNATISRASNGTIEFTPENQFDLNKLVVGSVVVVYAADSPKDAAEGVSKKSSPRRA